jgi:hypothetical protein
VIVADTSGQKVVIEGSALNGRAGALVQTDDKTTYYVGGLDEWSDELVMKRVSVTGVLRVRAATVETRPPEAPQLTGLTRATRVLDDATWTLVS